MEFIKRAFGFKSNNKGSNVHVSNALQTCRNEMSSLSEQEQELITSLVQQLRMDEFVSTVTREIETNLDRATKESAQSNGGEVDKTEIVTLLMLKMTEYVRTARGPLENWIRKNNKQLTSPPVITAIAKLMRCIMGHMEPKYKQMLAAGAELVMATLDMFRDAEHTRNLLFDIRQAFSSKNTGVTGAVEEGSKMNAKSSQRGGRASATSRRRQVVSASRRAQTASSHRRQQQQQAEAGSDGRETRVGRSSSTSRLSRYR